MSDIARDAINLPPNQRLSLARFLLELSESSIPSDPDADEAWDEEIAKRIERVRSGSATTRPAEEIFAELDRRFPG